MEDLNSSAGTLKWLLSSKTKKQKAVEAYNSLIGLIDGDYGSEAETQISNADVIDRSSNSDAWQDFATNSVRFFNDLEDINPGVLGNDDLMYGLPEDLAREVQEECFFPDGLLCELRRYQEWGVKYALHQERILLGDEMGLGKTVQAIATMVSLRNTGGTHFVVVCPASVITNWCREIRKMSLLSVTKIHGTGRKAALQSWIKSGGVAVTTYETTAYFELPEDFKFKMLVVDEAHYIKNPEARRINGAVTPQRRQEIIDEFDKAPAGTVLVAQIQSGGTGLNIQSASVVVLCEPQFKPSIENQAISRAYRMGQTRNVLVYRLLCEDTVDEKIMSTLESKQAIFDAFADKSVAAAESQEIDDRTFGNIIKEEIDRINAKYGNTK